MSLGTEPAPVSQAAPASQARATFGNVLRAEWTKVRTLRTTIYLVLFVVLVGTIYGGVFSWIDGAGYPSLIGDDQAGFDPTATSLRGYAITQLATGFLGIHLIASEYSTGLIRTTFSVVPRRSRLLGAKALITVAITLVAGALSGLGSFLVGQGVLGANDAPTASLGDAGVLRAALGVGPYLAIAGLLGLGIGALVRSPVGAFSILAAVNLVIPATAANLPGTAGRMVQQFWPSAAGSQIATVVRQADTLPPWAGLGLFAAATGVVLIFGFRSVVRRDP